MTAATPGFRLRFLGFYGPQKQPSSVTFGPGLNVIYGASNTGKSFIVEAIDFMLGGKPPLRDIPERVGYDLILLGLETLDGKSFTLWRSMDGGGFRLYDGLHQPRWPVQIPPPVATPNSPGKTGWIMTTQCRWRCVRRPL